VMGIGLVAGSWQRHGNGEYSRSSSHLSSLALEASDALLSPLRSHLECWTGVSKSEGDAGLDGALLDSR